jgi:HK97 family phage prohead protease
MSDTESGGTIRRTFQAQLQPSGDGRTLDLRVVPFNTVARVKDPGREPYDEMWVDGCFDKQINAANRVLVNFEHEFGFQNVVGRGVELRSDAAALDGTFRILQGPDGDKALELINEKVLTGVSLEAIPLRSEKGPDGVVRRIAARLVNVALCRFPAFAGAEVLAVREGDPDAPTPDDPAPSDPEPTDPPAPEPEPERRSDVDLALERVGFEALVKRAVTRKPWNGSPARFEDDEYQRSCLIDRGGDAPPKERCSLPVLEPNGDINANALGAAAAALAGARGGLAGVSMAQKATAARKLMRLYRQAQMQAPPSLMTLASR